MIAGGAIVAVLLLIAPNFIYPVFAMELLCFALFACAFNLSFGHAGMLSFGHAAFFGSAAYITGYAVKALSIPPVLGILFGVLVASFLGLIFGLIALRQRGIYFAMITLGLAEVVYFIALDAPFTGGEDGLQGIPRGELFGLFSLHNDVHMYYFVLVVTIASLLLIRRVILSPYGQILRAINSNEARAMSLGYRPTRYLLVAFVLSAALSGVAGGMEALVMNFASLTNVHWHQSGDVVLMALIGGAESIIGPALGAIFVTALHQYLASLGQWVDFIIGGCFAGSVLMFRSGFVGSAQKMLAAVRSRGTDANHEPEPHSNNNHSLRRSHS